MNPLATLTYYLRHRRQTLMVIGLVSLMTFGVCIMVRLLDSVPESYKTAANYLTRVNLVFANGPVLDPGVVAQIRTYQGIAQVIPEKGLEISLPPVISAHHFFGVSEVDMRMLLEVCDLRLKEGRLPIASTNQFVVTEEMAAAMGIQIGDRIDSSVGKDIGGESWYASIPVPIELVGILEGVGPGESIRLGMVSYEFVNNHELFGPPWVPGLILIPQPGHISEVENFLENEIAPQNVTVSTYQKSLKKNSGLSSFFYILFGIIDILVAVVITQVIGVINRIVQARRLDEFGVLNAIGYGKRWLICRLTFEAVGITCMGWLAGLVLSWMGFAALRMWLFEPRGLELGFTNLTPIWFSLPIPLISSTGVAAITWRTFTRLDAIAIIERGKLSLETGITPKPVKHSSMKSLYPKTYHLRHRRQGLIVFVTMSLMILGVSFPAFLFTPIGDAMRAFAEPLRQIGIVTPLMQGPIDSGVTAQLKSHPMVARAIPAVELEMVVQVPPLAWPISIYGVTENDLKELLTLFSVHVQEGRLPRPNANEVVLSEAMALNRELNVGDRIGQPVNEDDPNIRTEMEIVGILSPTNTGNDLWLGFASYEYLTSHELYVSHSIHMLTIPQGGQKAGMDAFLREEVNPDLIEAYTYDWMLKNYQLLVVLFLAIVGIVELVITIVAAVALAVLSYVLFAQRREEFGILHALGHERRWLVWRTVRETASAIGLAWLLSSVVCGFGLLGIQHGLYIPRGLSLNFFNPIPWLFTLPIPVAVIAASGGMVARMLRVLDPVSIIERR
jgi:ABC-type lipoprotein release transport system permease subunit